MCLVSLARADAWACDQDELRSQVETLAREKQELARRNRDLLRDNKQLRMQVEAKTKEHVVLQQQLERAKK